MDRNKAVRQADLLPTRHGRPTTPFVLNNDPPSSRAGDDANGRPMVPDERDGAVNALERNPASFASWVRRRRTAAMLTQEDLAALTAVSVRTIRNIEAGRGARAQTLRLLVSGLTGAPAPPPAPPADPVPVPAQLVGDVAGFIGREPELRALDAHLTAARGGTHVPAIAVLSGPAGVGKTGLAVHWAHGARPAFPDGQLFANLRGSTPGSAPGVADVLAGFLRALGVSHRAVPPGVDERAARFRTILAGRRMLVVLDDVATAEQVRPLLPGTAGAGVLITSRNRLAELVARTSARRLELGPLPPWHAVRLLRILLGEQAGARLRGADALAEFAERCGRLPLALRTAAEAAPMIPTPGPAVSRAGTSPARPSRSAAGPALRR